MDTREKDIEKLKDYKYGFSTDIENIRAPKGLDEDVIKFISNIKKEPKWMLEWRLKAFKRLKNLNSGSFLELGVGDGTENNTLILLSLGWNGFWVGGSDLAFDTSNSKKLKF